MKSTGPNWFNGEFSQTFKKEINSNLIFVFWDYLFFKIEMFLKYINVEKYSQEYKWWKTVPNPLNEVSITLLPKLDQDSMRKENLPQFLSWLYMKNLNKIWAKNVYQ